MTPLALRDRDRADDGRAAPRSATRSPDADLVELRLDSVSDPNVAGALAGRRRPVIVTCRPTWEGGRVRRAPRRSGARILRRGARARRRVRRHRVARALRRSASRRPAAAAIVLSTHDFDGVPADLAGARAGDAGDRRRGRQDRRADGDGLSDCVPLLDLGAQIGRQGGLVLIGMGDARARHARARRPVRIAWTYAGRDRERRAADAGRRCSTSTGSARVDRHDRCLRRRRAAGRALGLAGDAQRGVRARRGLDAVYLPLPAADADDFVTLRAARSACKGASVTTPFKVALFERVDEVDAVARRIGAINTIRVDRRPLAGRQHRRERVSRAARSDRVPLERPARVACSAPAARRARSPWRSRRAARRSRVHAREPRAGRGGRDAASARRVGPWPPARRQLGPARQLHAGRHVSATSTRRRSPAARSDRAAASTTSSTTRRTTRLLREAAARGLPDDRRPRDARRAGAASSSSGGPACGRRPASCGRPR